MWGSEPFWGLGYDWDPDVMHMGEIGTRPTPIRIPAAEDEAKEPILR